MNCTSPAQAMPDLDPLYIAARRVLLDALEALAPHRSAIIVVGAQAVYLRSGAADLGVTPYTTDGDLALDPRQLGDEPLLEAAMQGANFRRDLQQPGVWLATTTLDGREVNIPVDLIVPEGATEAIGRRGARLGGHGNRAARRATGLEAVLVDHSPVTISALQPDDRRAFEVEVAGATALLVAKAHKIHDRLDSAQAGRAEDKDAADVYRLMQTNSPIEIGHRMAGLCTSDLAGPPTVAAIEYLDELFGRNGGAGVEMAVRALRLAIPEAQVRTLATSFVERMLTVLTT
jgi:hypothetical protein